MQTIFQRASFVLAALTIAAAPAIAQDTSSPELSPWNVPGWSFIPGVIVSVLHDSNVALASAPASTHTTQGDNLFIGEPFGQLKYAGRRTDFSSGYGGYLRRYAEFNELDGFDQRGYLTLRHLATRRITLFVHDTYINVPTTDEVELNGIPFSRTGSRFNTAAAGIEARLTKFTDLHVRYDQAWVSFDRNASSQLRGGVVNGFLGDLSHRLDRHTSVGAEYGVRFADMNEETRQVMFQDAGGTLSYEIASGTELSFAGGLSRFSDQTRAISRTGPYLRAGVTHKTDRATVGASYERMYVPSFGFGGSNQSEQARAFIQMPLTRNRTYVQSSIAWRHSDPFVANELKLDTLWVRSTLGYALQRWLRLEGFYTFTRQSSEIPGGQIHRHRGGVQFVISSPVRIR